VKSDFLSSMQGHPKQEIHILQGNGKVIVEEFQDSGSR